MTRTTSMFLAAAAAMLGAVGMPGGAPAEPLQVQLTKRDAQWPAPAGLVAPTPAHVGATRRALGGAWRIGGLVGWHYPKPGHSVRQGQRMARKRRNVAAHRGACRAAAQRRA